MPFFFPVGGTSESGATTFVELYGTKLDRALGSADRTKLFTTARRQEAINDGQREFVKLTECLSVQGEIAIVDETAEYDLDAELDRFTWLTKQGVEVRIVDSDGNVRILGGEDLPLRTVDWLNRYTPGWRAADPSTPTAKYQREDGGSIYLGLTPAPSIASGETWTLIVPYLALPDDLVNDDDAPFTVDSNPKRSLWPWHRALVHYAAAELEQFRKDQARADFHMKLFAGDVADYLQKQRPRGGQQITLARDYRGEARRASNPPLNPLRDV